MQAPSALAADLPRSEALTVALMQGCRKAENTALRWMIVDGIRSQKWMSTTTLVHTRDWLAGSPTDLTGWVMPRDKHRW